MRTKWLSALAAVFLTCVSSFAAEGGLTVRMKSDEEMSVMVLSGAGAVKFNSENDFLIIGKNGETIAPIYPFEIFEDRFWSEPLSEEVYKKIEEGMEVRPVTLEKEPHWEIRYRGTEFTLYRKKKQVAELKKILEALLGKTNYIKDNLQTMGVDISNSSEKSDEMRTANKLRHDIDSLLEDRDSINKKMVELEPVTERNQKKFDRLREDLIEKENELNEKRQELEREENRAGMSNTRIFAAMREAGAAMQNASLELQALSTELFNALSQLEYIEQNMQNPSRKHKDRP